MSVFSGRATFNRRDFDAYREDFTEDVI